MFSFPPPGLLCASLSKALQTFPRVLLWKPFSPSLPFLRDVGWGAEQGCRGAGRPPDGQLSGSAAHPTPVRSAAAAASAGRRGTRGDVHKITAHVKGSFGIQLCVFCALRFTAVLVVAILCARRSILVCSRCSCYGRILAIHPEGAQHIQILFSALKISFGLCLIQEKKGSLLSRGVLRQLLASHLIL